MRKLLVILALCAAPAAAQPPGIWWNGGGSGSGSADPAQFSSPAGTLTVGGSVGAVTLDCDGSVCVFYSTGTSDPATCTQGGMFHYRTDSSLLKFCSATNTWGQIVTAANTSTSGFGFVVDEDNMASDSATKVPTQQSVKAYVDSFVGFDRTGVTIFEDFIGGTGTTGQIGSTGASFTATSTGTVATTASVLNHPGMFRLNSHATNDNSGAAVALNNTGGVSFNWQNIAAGDWTYEAEILPGSNSTAITNVAFGAGLSATSTLDTTTGYIGVRYDTDKSDGTYICMVCDSSSSGCQSAGDSTNINVVASTVTPIAGTWNRIRLYRLASGVGGIPTIYCSVDGETPKTFCASGCDDVGTNVPVSDAVSQVLVWYLTRTTTGVMSGDVDYIYWRMPSGSLTR